jgi:hypothetical protein
VSPRGRDSGGQGFGGQGFGDRDTDELVATEPGLERLVTALTADGDATELLGRQAALTMFRSARAGQASGQQAGSPADTARLVIPVSGTSASLAPGRSGARARRSTRAARSVRGPRRSRASVLTTIAAAMVAACAGVAVAAYATALPDPVQQIAHHVLAPLGVPSAPSHGPSPSPGPSASQGGGPGSPAGSTGPTGSSGSGGSPGSSNGATPSASVTPSASASASPTATTSPTSPPPGPASLTLTAATTRVTAGGQDTFTAQLTQGGQPLAQVKVRLMERAANAFGPQVAATGITGPDGSVTLVASGLMANAFFHVEATTGPYKMVSSPKIAVMVIPRLDVQVTGTTLTVRAFGAVPGDVVTLQKLSGSAWINDTTRQLDLQGSAAFTVVSGTTYRVALRPTAVHAHALSPAVQA